MAEHSDFLELLTGPSAGEMLSAAVEAGGGELLSWQPNQVDHHVAGTTVAYRTEIHQGSSRRVEVLCATAGGNLPEGAAVIGADDLQVGIWAAAAGDASGDEPRRCLGTLRELRAWARRGQP